MLDNYQEETQPLFKLLRNEAFRFIIVRYNHYSLVQQLQKDLQQRFPDRPVNTFNAKTVDYHQLTQAYYDLGSGFFFIENFDDLLKEDKNSLGQETPETAQNNERRRHITAGLNLRRDKLAKYPIALIVFIGFSADSLYAKKIMEKMPDLWSFRSLLLDLEMPLANDQPDWQNQQTEITNRSLERPLSSLSGTDKQAELNRLLELLAATPKNETSFRQTLYPQIADLQNDLGDYQAAIDTLQTWGKIVNDDEKSQIWFKMGDIYGAIGDLQAALEQFSHVLQWAEEHGNKDGIATCHERLGDIYTQLGDLDKALTLFQTYHKLQKELFTSDPTNIHFKSGLAISYSKLGETHAALGHLDQALQFYEEQSRLGKEVCESYPTNVSFKDGLAISYQNLGNTYAALGQLDQALQFYEEQSRLGKELYESYPTNVRFKNGLAISYEKLGSTHAVLGNFDQILQFFQDSNALEKQLHESYPNNVEFKNNLAVSYSKLGETHADLGQLDQALQFYQDYNVLKKQLYDSYPNNVSFKNGLAISYAKLGQFNRDQLKDNTKAQTYFLQAETLWIELVRDAPHYVEFKKYLDLVREYLA